MNPEQAQALLDTIQKAAFRMADGWARGINLEFAGVDMSAPMLYQMCSIFNQQMVGFYFPPQPPVVAEVVAAAEVAAPDGAVQPDVAGNAESTPDAAPAEQEANDAVVGHS